MSLLRVDTVLLLPWWKRTWLKSKTKASLIGIKVANMTIINEKFILEIIVIFSSLIPKAVKRKMTRQEFYCDCLDLARRFQVQSFPKILPMMLMLYGLILCGGQMWHQVRLSQRVTKLFHYSFPSAQFVKEVSWSCCTLNPFITRALTASSSGVTMLN